jgi:putative hydrolase of the HAD superfamily
VALGRVDGLEAVTVDAYGTLVELDEPVRRLQEALRRRGIEREDETVARAFGAEVAYYKEHKLEGRDSESVAELCARCARVFTDAAACELDFADDFGAALVFVPLPGVREALEQLRAAGLRLAVVSNWDVGLGGHLDRLGLGSSFEAVVTSAEVGAEKPDPAIFRLALERLGLPAARVLHVGDDEADELGARAAGLRFAPAPLADAVAGLA